MGFRCVFDAAILIGFESFTRPWSKNDRLLILIRIESEK